MVNEQKFETVDGYSIVDIGGAAKIIGPIRSAKKVLQRTTIDLVRHVTYALAVHGHNASGGAAALNHDRAAEDQSPIETFSAELTDWATSAGFVGSAGLGLGANEIGSALHASAASANELIAASAAACLAPDTTKVVIASDGDEPALQARLAAKGVDATVEADLGAALASNADAVFVRAKTGALNHEVVADANVGRIIGLQPLTTTARGLAVAGRQDTIIIPDFISAAGPYLAAFADLTDTDSAADSIATATSDVLAAIGTGDINLFVNSCVHAETHLRSWTSDLPFGRPLAP